MGEVLGKPYNMLELIIEESDKPKIYSMIMTI